MATTVTATATASPVSVRSIKDAEKSDVPIAAEASLPSPSVDNAVAGKVSLYQIFNKGELIMAWASLLLLTVVSYFDNLAAATFNVYAISEFQHLSIEGSLATILSVVTIAMQGPLAAFTANIQPFFVLCASVVLADIGLIVCAAARDIGTFIGGYIIFTVGGMTARFLTILLAAELSNIKYRSLSIAGTLFPAVIALLAGGPMAQTILDNLGWRWGFGIWTIVLLVGNIPLLVMLFIAARRLRRLQTPSASSATQRILKALRKQDPIGIALLVVGIAMLLLPIPLDTKGVASYAKATNLVPTVLGVVVLAVFGVWEARFARNPLLPHRIFRNLSAMSALLTNFTQYLWPAFLSTYMYTYLVIAGNQSISHATYITNSLAIVLYPIALVYGWAAAKAGRGKWIFTTANAFIVLGFGIAYAFVDVSKGFGGLLGGLCIIGTGFGGMINVLQLIENELPAEDIPIATALFFLTSNVAAALSNAVVGGVYTSVLPRYLKATLPTALKPEARMFIQDINAAQAYAVGSPERTVITAAFVHIYKNFILTCLVISAIGFLISLFVKNAPFREPDMTTVIQATESVDEKFEGQISSTDEKLAGLARAAEPI